MLTRRQLLGLSAASPLLIGPFAGCATLAELQPQCTMSWDPNLIDPMYAARTDVAQQKVSLYYPTPTAVGLRPRMPAPILQQCGRFPLVMLITGDCPDDPIRSWDLVARQLARAGYVVAVPDFTTSYPNDVGDVELYANIVRWIRSEWPYASTVLPDPNTCCVGHSYGGMCAALLAATQPAGALATIDAEFGDWNAGNRYLPMLSAPTLLAWGTSGDEASLGSVPFDIANPAGSPFFPLVNRPRCHAVAFVQGQHGDWFGEAAGPPCASQYRGACALTPQLIADYLTTFISANLTPEFETTVSSWVPDSLVLKAEALANAHIGQAALGNYLGGLRQSSLVPTPPDKLYRCLQYSGWYGNGGWQHVWVAQAGG